MAVLFGHPTQPSSLVASDEAETYVAQLRRAAAADRLADDRRRRTLARALRWLAARVELSYDPGPDGAVRAHALTLSETRA